jgi:glutamine synthetase
LPTRRWTEGTRFPFSVLNLDIWGEDIEDSPLVFAPAIPTAC